MNDSALVVNNLVYSFDDRLLFDGVNFSVKTKSITAVVGTNNSGKTTLIRVIAAKYMTNDVINIGRITLSERSLTSYNKNVSYISFKSFDFSCNTVLEELLSEIDSMSWTEDKKEKIVSAILGKFDLDQHKYSKPTRLSNKNKISVLLAKALIKKPKVLVMELSDNKLTKSDKNELFLRLDKYIDLGLSVIYETNNSEDILYSNRMIVLHKGNIVMEGATKKVLSKDSLLLKLGVELPFIVDLSLKLKFYDLIDKIYLSQEDLVNKLWK